MGEGVKNRAGRARARAGATATPIDSLKFYHLPSLVGGRAPTLAPLVFFCFVCVLSLSRAAVHFGPVKVKKSFADQ